MKWEIKNKVISSLKVNGFGNIILPWGIETSDYSSFFSLEEKAGYRYDILFDNLYHDDSIYSREIIIKFRSGKFKINIVDELLEGKSISRKVNVEFLEDTYLMDFVIRYRFKSNFVESVRIHNEILFHKNTNVNHQFPVKEVRVNLVNGGKILLDMPNYSINDKFTLNSYVRDFGKEWVIHQRLLPNTSDKNVVKLCSKYFKTLPLPFFLSDILLRNKYFMKQTFYRGERKRFASKFVRVFNPNTFPMVLNKKGESFNMESKLIYYAANR